MSIQDTRTSERYQPRWELWMGVFIHYGMSNVVNSLASFEVTTRSGGGSMSSETIVAWDKLVGNVLLFEALIMNNWRKGAAKEDQDKLGYDKEYSKAQKHFYDFIKEPDPHPIQAMFEATQFFHQLIQLLSRRGLLRFKPPRSFGRKHDE